MRHGEVHNPQQILYGRLPGFGLSALGRQQAAAAGAWLAAKPIQALYCSPMQRARETAALVAAAHGGLSPQVDERLIEVATPYEGEPIDELAAMGWDLYSGNQPPYEVPATVLARVLDFFDYARAAHVNEAIVAVAHGDILVFPWLHAQGEAPEALMKDHLLDYGLPVAYPATASIMIFELGNGPRPRVRYHCPW